MKPIKIKRIQAKPGSIKSKKPNLTPFLNENGQIVYITETQRDQIVERQRKGWEELRGIWEDKDDSFFDLGGK